MLSRMMGWARRGARGRCRAPTPDQTAVANWASRRPRHPRRPRREPATRPPPTAIRARRRWGGAPETAPPQGYGELVSTVTAPGGGGGMGGAVNSIEEGAGSTGDVGSGAASLRTAEVPAPGLAASARLPATAVMATAAAASNGVEGGGKGGPLATGDPMPMAGRSRTVPTWSEPLERQEEAGSSSCGAPGGSVVTVGRAGLDPRPYSQPCAGV